MQNDSLCPECKQPLYFCLDEWGRTPWHLHCDNCNINIGVNKPEKAIEYYNNDIQILFEEEKRKIFKEI